MTFGNMLFFLQVSMDLPRDSYVEAFYKKLRTRCAIYRRICTIFFTHAVLFRFGNNFPAIFPGDLQTAIDYQVSEVSTEFSSNS